MSDETDRRSQHERRNLDGRPPSALERRANASDRRGDRNLRLVTFRIERDIFAIDVHRLQEVVLGGPTTKVPLAPPAVEGLLNLRGQVVAVFSLRRVFGYANSHGDHDPVYYVVTTPEGPVGFVVDEQGDYEEVSLSFFRPPPVTMNKQIASRLDGICELPGGRIVMVVGVDGALGQEESVEA